ncbi:hypothetical protein ACH61_01754 [Rathayibacter tanaceti]|uniref:Uncharacterized protein n=1 Tax=Rathayibacter tanaceti TaxID=1671680 RepID=A0A162GQ99_9MICO|nr:hypothetical protein ACH61_01754 [Rathayibacter tanaceti]
MPKRPRISWPSITFSPMLRLSVRRSSWNTAVMPAAFASAGPLNRRVTPSTTISPASGWWMPVSVLISVDLPAPFSPIRP